MHSCKLLSAFLCGIIGLSTAAFAEEEQASPSDYAPVLLEQRMTGEASRVVQSFYASKYGRMAGLKLEIGTVNLDDDPVLEIATRFVHDRLCTISGCLLTVLDYNENQEQPQWEEVFSHPAHDLHVRSEKETGQTFADLRTNDMLTWKWNDGRYRLSMQSLGQKIDLTLYEKGDFYESMLPLLPSSNQSDQPPETVYRTPIKLATIDMDGQGREGVVFYLDHQRYCGASFGCWVRIMEKTTDGWQLVMEGASIGEEIILSDHKTNGVKDVALFNASGWQIMKWNGSEYKLGEQISSLAE